MNAGREWAEQNISNSELHAARLVMVDETQSLVDRMAACDILFLAGSESDVRDSNAFREQMVPNWQAEQEAMAPSEPVDAVVASMKGMVYFLCALVVVAGVAVSMYANHAMTQINYELINGSP
jgi:hypothetical protein